jgi:single-strand DNA-binding protein
MNKVFLIGRLVKDPELRYTGNNTPVATFTLAVRRQASEESDFIPIVFWSKQGETCGKYLKKGSRVSVLGRIQVRSYEDKEGKRRYATEVIGESFEFLDSKKADSKNETPNPFEEFANEIQEENLPF